MPVSHERFMRLALRLARRGEGLTSPNPMVGAVLVKAGRIVATGFHRKAGSAHAEVAALMKAGSRARGCDLYINMEPCTHHGRTPPCLPGLLSAGVRRAFVGMKDPNPLVCGRGIKGLKKAGVEVHTGILEDECRRLNQAFSKLITKGIPFVTLKAAVSLDGKLASSSGESRWISCERSRRIVHRMRAASDAVLVGVGTVLKDNPGLYARGMSRPAPQPIRVIADSHLHTPANAALFSKPLASPVIVATTAAAPERKAEQLRSAGAEILRLPSSSGRVSLRHLLEELGRRQVTSVLVEGGSTIFTSFITEGLADKVVVFVAPILIGGGGSVELLACRSVTRLADARRLKDVSVRRCGDDALVVGYFAP